MRIAILSRGRNLYSTKRLAQACKERGHEVEIIDYLKCYVLTEEGNPHIYYKGEMLENVDAIIPRIGASKTFYGSAIVRQFEMMGVFTVSKSQAIVRSRDKLRSLQILSKHSVGMPKTAFTASPSDVNDIIKKVGGTPLVIKLLEGTQGKGVVLAETISAARSVLDAFYGLKANILVQEYIKEAKGADIRAFVVGGKVVGAMKRQGAEGEFRSNIHRGGTSEQIKLSTHERKTAINAAGAMGLNVAGVDMLQSSRGALVMEVNSSPGLQGIESATKTDIASKIIKFIEENAGKKRQRDKVGL
jgi:ribosomal protein S6--L-glutamate ligase